MIIRRALWQSGRRAVSGASVLNPCRRPLSTLSSDLDQISSSLQHAEKELHSIRASQKADVAPSSVAVAAAVATAAGDQIAENFVAFQKQQAHYGKIGTSVAPHYQPHNLVNNPPSPSDITLELLLASEAHQGHSTSLWNPANARYIFGIRQGIHIISLEQTAAHLRRACRVVTEVASKGGLILFVGTRDGQQRIIVKAAELAGGYHLFEKWVPGSITNGAQILGRAGMKVVDEFDNEVTGFEEQLRDRAPLRPDLVVVLNPLENRVLLDECSTNQIPSIGIIDTDANPTWVTYPIPANDDSLRCTQLIGGILGRAGQEGRKIRFEAAKRNVRTWQPAEGLQLPGQENVVGEDGAETFAGLGLKPKED